MESTTARRLNAAGATFALHGTHVSVNDVPIPLSPLEYRVLAELLGRANLAVSREVLVAAVTEMRPSDDEILDATVTGLRRRLGPAGSAIRSVTDLAYTFTASSLFLD